MTTETYRPSVHDTRILFGKRLPSPRELRREIPYTDQAEQYIKSVRQQIQKILEDKDDRKIVKIGPCSIHSYEQAIEYAYKFKDLQVKAKNLLLLMRVYLEKPRSGVGWPGFVSDPDLVYYTDRKSCDKSKGLRESRRLLSKLTEMEIPCTTEFLWTINPEFYSEYIADGAIGARTTKSQLHKALASGFSMPIGFKNNTSGDINVAIQAAKSSREPHNFDGIDEEGYMCDFLTIGNPDTYVILRGGNGVPNCHPDVVKKVIEMHREANIKPNLVIDCSHANCIEKDANGKPAKKYEKQIDNAHMVLEQMLDGTPEIKGIMIESNLVPGQQSFPKTFEERTNLNRDTSLTDPCINWEDTELVVMNFNEELGYHKQTK